MAGVKKICSACSPECRREEAGSFRSGPHVPAREQSGGNAERKDTPDVPARAGEYGFLRSGTELAAGNTHASAVYRPDLSPPAVLFRSAFPSSGKLRLRNFPEGEGAVWTLPGV